MRQQERRQRLAAPPPAEAGGMPGDAVRAAPPRRARRRRQARQAGQGREPQGHADFARRAAREAARKLPVDRSKYQTIRTLDELKAWIARAYDAGHFAIDARRIRRSDAGRHLRHRAGAGAERRLLCPARPQAVRRRRGLFDAGLAPDQIKAADALAALKPLLESSAFSRSASTSSSTP
jgi:DNA polymerase-1